jgi:iron complex outermembrane receptor protein
VRRNIFILGFIFSFINFCFCEERVDLGQILITPYRYEESLNKVASAATLITSKDIANSNASNVADIFRPVSGITVRDWYGNGTKSSVDMSGFGEQAALNVLVLIDGRRANDVDLSGVDWKQIPLDEVERIEIIHGGSGAVLYGDNASSGVINIITKEGSGKLKVNLKNEYGSYDMNKQKLSLGGAIDDKFSYWLSAGREGNHGYRHNSFSKDKDFASKLAYKLNDILSIHFDSGFHISSYGMPGSLTQSVINQYGRKHARYGEDHTNNKDYYFVTGIKNNFLKFGNFNIDFSYRQKDADSYFLTSGLDTIKNKTETFGVVSKYTLANSILNHENKFIAGIDFYRTLYTSQTYYYSRTASTLEGALNQYSNINKNSIGWYLQNEFSLSNKLIFLSGYRYEFARYSFAYHDNNLHNYGANPDQDSKLKPDISIFNGGLVYAYNDDSNIFFNISRSFRFPEVDEFTYIDANWQKQLNTDLKPQHSLNYQLGFRHKLSERINGSLSFSRMNVKDEIYFNAKDFLSWGSWMGKNENYDKTIHQSIETSLDAKINDWFTLFGNYTFTNAYFKGGEYSKNKIPLVPENKGSIGFRLSLPKNVTFNMTGTYLGERYFLNDQANIYSHLNGYMLADANLSWHYKDLIVTFGVNNLFGKQYSEYAGVTVDSGEKFYYPSPKRNFSLKIEYTF